jgi:hypothetical protein
VKCGESLVVTPGHLPPWILAVTDPANVETFRRQLSGGPEQGVMIRSDGAFAGEWPLPGGPAPATTCPSS